MSDPIDNFQTLSILMTENDVLRNQKEFIEAERDRYKEALEKLAKGNRSPDVLKIAKQALEGK